GRSLLIEPEAPLGIDVRRRTDDEFDAWVAIFTEGFANPDGEGVPGSDDFPRDVVANAMRDIEKAGAANYVALCDGVIAGVGSVRLTDGIAQLTGAATAPAFRRRGAQSALLTARLRDAAAAECDIAVVTTAPGSRSQKNVQNKGFQLLYTRAVMVKAPEAG
ncbi:MAG TPA: GNAT family N-acetyltransferase, partial [Mycobacterium sp.]|nr:GNAT family N-acetyltransferase [Mycobacterium sp.]